MISYSKYILEICSFFTILLLTNIAYSYDPQTALPRAEEVNNWRILETRLIRTEAELFKYMDGGAELYFAFNFRRLAVREFINSDSVVFSVEVFLFKDPTDAYGIFSLIPAGDEVPFGDGAGFSESTLRFWKGPFFVRIFHNGEVSDLLKPQVLKIAQAVDKRIEVHGSPPALISLLPVKERANHSVRFLHDYIAQKNVVYIAPYNLFHLQRNTDLVFAEYYNLKSEHAFLFLIKYPNITMCQEAYQDIVKRFLKEEVKETGDLHLSKMVENRRNVEIDAIADFLLFGFEDINRDLLALRMRDLRERVIRQVGK